METFDESAALLLMLLAEHGRPTTLVWVEPEHVVRLGTRVFVRVPREPLDSHKRLQFENARAAGRAVGLDVRGHSAGCSFVVLDVASDDRDAELRMMSDENVKLSIPDSPLPLVREVHTGTAWATLRLVGAS